MINAGVSGDTTAGGLARLEWALADRPHAVIVALGANDALRAIDPEVSSTNLDRLLEALAERTLPVLLAGMMAPRNLGREYGERFDAIYPELAARHGVALYPFLLDGVATVAALNQADGIHPNPAGVEVIVERILPSVLCLAQRTGHPAAATLPPGGNSVSCRAVVDSMIKLDIIRPDEVARRGPERGGSRTSSTHFPWRCGPSSTTSSV